MHEKRGDLNRDRRVARSGGWLDRVASTLSHSKLNQASLATLRQVTYVASSEGLFQGRGTAATSSPCTAGATTKRFPAQLILFYFFVFLASFGTYAATERGFVALTLAQLWKN